MHMSRQRILITGAAGGVGTMLRPRMARPGRTLRLLDEVETPPLDGADEEILTGSVTDLEAMTAACQGVDAVIHLGGQSREHDIQNVLKLNVEGSYVTLEAARRAGVGRVVLASSNHAVGFHSREGIPEGGLPADASPRPDTLYGLSKVGIEAAGRMFADRYGMDVIAVRIGSWFGTPPGVRGLATWLSPDDGARLMEACIAAESPGFRLVWGISRNTRRWFSLAEGEAIGYHPQDDAEDFAAEMGDDKADYETDPELNRVGGSWCEVELGLPMT
jgi:uronate dehydrogenase